MHTILKQDIQKKMMVLKANKLFETLSTNKLQKLSYNLKNVTLKKNQVLYKEGQPQSGVYLIVKGSLKY